MVTDWNAIASTTIVANGGKSPAASAVWFAYMSLAEYDAVNAITGQYRPFYYRIVGTAGRIHRRRRLQRPRIACWSTTSPRNRAALDSQLFRIVSGDHRRLKRQGTTGVAVGEAAAMAVITARMGDGLEANVTYTPGQARVRGFRRLPPLPLR